MAPTDTAILAALIFAAAVLYSSVGHAGASGYLAAMALVGLAPHWMKPTALVLNILVASITLFQFQRAGCFSWASLWPFALGSVPASFVGGALDLPTHLYRPIVGVILLCGAVRLFMPTQPSANLTTKAPPLPAAMAWGVAIGLLSGLTGTGGGIFLSPLLLFAGWANTRQTGGVSAGFILLNSIAGLAGRLTSLERLPGELPLWAGAAVAGGLIGSRLGSRKLAPMQFRRVLGVGWWWRG